MRISTKQNAGLRAVPIYQTTSYVFEDVDHAAALFNLRTRWTYLYAITNPTNAVLEERVAALEGGTGALATASGMSAIFLAIMTLCKAGDHIVASQDVWWNSKFIRLHFQNLELNNLC